MYIRILAFNIRKLLELIIHDLDILNLGVIKK